MTHLILHNLKPMGHGNYSACQFDGDLSVSRSGLVLDMVLNYD